MRHRIFFLPAGLICALLTFTSCSKPPAATPPPPPAVTVARPIVRDATELDVYTGTLAAKESVELRARVAGEVVLADFTEGKVVEKGKLLFKIDPRPYENRVKASQGALQQAQAKLALARNDFDRGQETAKSGAISNEELDTRRQNFEQAKGVVTAAEAQLATDQLNLEWTSVVAPITGQVGRKVVTVGNLVTGGADQGSVLTTIYSVDPIYVYVEADESSILKYTRLADEGKRTSARDSVIPCEMQLSDEKNWRQGVVDFVNNRVDQNTATLQARAVFPNPGGRMLPGLFARVRVMGAMHPNAILVSDSAVTAEEDIYVALVVNAENKVEKRIVTRGALIGSLRIIEKGISKDDWVVINGRQKAQPKSVVDPIRATMADNPPEEKLLEAGAPATTASPATTPATTQSGGVP